jgi:quinoprotein glucose dehydrogenase
MEDPIVAVYLQDVDPAIATEAARAIHDMPITGAMADLAASLSRACTLPWQRRAISAAERLGTDSGLAGLVDFASNEANPESMRLLALDVLRTWRDPPPRERVEGTWRPVDFSPRSADLLKDRLFALLPSATGPVLAAALQTALSHDVPVPRDLAASLLADPEQDIAVRVHCLRHLSDATTIESSLTNENEMIRAAARDLLFDSNRDRATALLVHAIETGSLRESQAAVLTLGRDEDALANITPQDLPVELWVEYEEASGNPVAFGDPNEGWWLSRGGDPDRGKELFHNHPHAQCLRCHAVGGVGGISGPALDGVASRLDEWSLQQSLLVPGAVISEGYGEYSTMPPMGMLLDHRELRDVMAWLQLLK